MVAVHSLAAGASTSICPSHAVEDARPPIYLPVGTGGLTRLELSPGVPGGLRRIDVSGNEIATLCTEGFDVRPLATDSLPASFSVVRRSGRVYGNLWTAERTPGDVATQWLALDVKSVGYFGQGEHVPIALFLDARSLVDTPAAIIGNGIIIGEVNLAPNGCGGTSFPAVPIANSEIEAYWRRGNSLWGESCGVAALRDGHVYRFLVEADTAGVVHYESREGTTALAASPLIDTSARRPSFDPEHAGILIASTNFCSACADFEIHFTNVASGWSAWQIGDPRIAEPPLLSPGVDGVTFGALATGTRSPSQRVTFTNATASGMNPAFRIDAGTSPSCQDDPTAARCATELDEARLSFVLNDSDCRNVRANGTCGLSVSFEPQGAFDIGAHLEYRVADGGIVRRITLEGYGLPLPMSPDQALSIEYFNARLGHYFMTPLTSEQGVLDSGTLAGWKRTGQWFRTNLPGSDAANGTRGVCRYYGRPEAGLDSHFYSASPAECAAVAQRFPGAWMLETPRLFDIRLPDGASGQCQSGEMPVFRLWNARASSNHRYTTDPGTRQRMIAAGWIAEGYGSTGAVMCSAAR
jgi:hypothetical protein